MFSTTTPANTTKLFSVLSRPTALGSYVLLCPKFVVLTLHRIKHFGAQHMLVQQALRVKALIIEELALFQEVPDEDAVL
jgi:hypothetical protein